jgi:hypothetical protein
MLGGDDQRGQEGGGPFGKLIVDFHTHLPPGPQVAAGSNAVPQFDTKETGGQAENHTFVAPRVQLEIDTTRPTGKGTGTKAPSK